MQYENLTEKQKEVFIGMIAWGFINETDLSHLRLTFSGWDFDELVEGEYDSIKEWITDNQNLEEKKVFENELQQFTKLVNQYERNIDWFADGYNVANMEFTSLSFNDLAYLLTEYAKERFNFNNKQKKVLFKRLRKAAKTANKQLVDNWI